MFPAFPRALVSGFSRLNVIAGRTPTNNHPRIGFLSKVHHGYYYSMSLVGVSAPLHSYPPLLPKAISSHTIALLDFYLIWSLLKSFSRHTKSLTLPPIYLSGAMEATYDGGRSLLPDPQHRSFLTIYTRSFLSIFSGSHNFLIIWLATFVSIVFCPEFVCTSSPHTYAALPDPLHSAL